MNQFYKPRDPARIDRMVEKLRALWHAHPDQRLGQLVDNATGLDHATFSIEDDVFEANVDLVLAKDFTVLYGINP
jgi:hypothetical protein